jgi:hypothetical protein
MSQPIKADYQWQCRNCGVQYRADESLFLCAMQAGLCDIVEIGHPAVAAYGKSINVNWHDMELPITNEFETLSARSNTGECRCDITDLMKAGCNCGAITRFGGSP